MVPLSIVAKFWWEGDSLVRNERPSPKHYQSCTPLKKREEESTIGKGRKSEPHPLLDVTDRDHIIPPPSAHFSLLYTLKEVYSWGHSSQGIVHSHGFVFDPLWKGSRSLLLPLSLSLRHRKIWNNVIWEINWQPGWAVPLWCTEANFSLFCSSVMREMNLHLCSPSK